ncbi:MAG: hypothetical protein KDD94_14575 [Calditrichaeota bacterium]|nr:hypothetical protein [Calditrichota bacterium]
MKKVCLLLLIIVSCTSPTEKPEIIHNFQLRLDLSQLPASVASIHGQLSNSNSDLIVFDFDFDTISHTANATVTEIPVGEWNLTVNALDENDIVTHSASTTVLIHSGLNEVNLVFEAVNGDLVIHIGWDSLAEIDLDSAFFQLFVDHDSTQILIENADPKTILKLYRPFGKSDNGLSFKFLESKYVHYIYMDRYYTALNSEGNAQYSNIVFNEDHPNDFFDYYLNLNFLELPVLQYGYGYTDCLISMQYSDAIDSDTTYTIYIFLILDSDTKAKSQSIKNFKNRIKFIRN